MAKMSNISPTTRSIFALIDGLLLFLALEAIFYAVAFLGLNLSFDTPTRPYLLCNLTWAVLSALLAGYTAARVARRSPMTHGIILAVPFVALAVYNLNKGVGGRRTWFVLAYNTLVPLAVLVGAFLYSRIRLRRAARRLR
jgi:hypothetical protein